MAFILADRVQETATANTTVSFTLSGAITSYQSFAAIGNTNNTYYGATDGTNWEVGFGTYSTTGPTLTRDTILSSSNSGSAVTFSGTVTVWCDYPAGKQISSDYPNNLGVVVPASVTATTITGQTARLNGTGTNLLLQSSSLTTTWTQSNSSLTGGQTDPFGGTTAAILNSGTAVSVQHSFFQATSYASNTFTLSIYAKAGTANFIGVYLSNPNSGVIFNLSTGSFSTNIGTAPTSFSITAVSGAAGWYRCSITVSGAQTFSQFFISEDGTNLTFTGTSKTITVAAPQLEIGSTANTYIPTTTTAVYGTPTLSFSGVSTIGLESNGSLFVQPAGTGALQAQATTSTTAGGNARGSYATDFQKSRFLASQVASGSSSTIGGGLQSTASGYASTVAGGDTNTASAGYSSVVGGNNNIASGNQASVVNGISNSATGFYGFVGTGFTNSTTANASVTTQSGTMNATTAVTLSGSNASIKVGQYIQGTSIASDTYVAAISGTSLTLSKVASGSSTSTLSFFTPHGVVVGGGNNQATGSYSFIGGGGDAGTAANRNTASGQWSVVCGGQRNTASGTGSVVSGGGVWSSGASIAANIASGEGTVIAGGAGNGNSGFLSTISGGYNNLSSGSGSVVTGGWSNNANSTFSTVNGGAAGSTRSIIGNAVFPASDVPLASPNASSQAALLILARQTTDATATALTSNISAASTTNQVILPNNSAYTFKGTLIANVTGGAASSSWEFRGAIERGANAASTVLVGTPRIDNIGYDSAASFWTFALTADTTNGGLRVTVTGQAGTTIRWVAKIETTEVTF
jgi:hypothetical protein